MSGPASRDRHYGAVGKPCITEIIIYRVEYSSMLFSLFPDIDSLESVKYVTSGGVFEESLGADNALTPLRVPYLSIPRAECLNKKLDV